MRIPARPIAHASLSIAAAEIKPIGTVSPSSGAGGPTHYYPNPQGWIGAARSPSNRTIAGSALLKPATGTLLASTAANCPGAASRLPPGSAAVRCVAIGPLLGGMAPSDLQHRYALAT